jgi:ABC-type uncharacterized transport system ATPase subunit
VIAHQHINSNQQCACSSDGRAFDFLDTRINTNSKKGVDVMLSTHYVGKITELAVAQAFLQRGYQVS